MSSNSCGDGAVTTKTKSSKKTGIDALIDAARQSQNIDLGTTQECKKSTEGDDYTPPTTDTKETSASNVVTKSNKKKKRKRRVVETITRVIHEELEEEEEGC